jgi:putative CocE/NonD family hydrolase
VAIGEAVVYPDRRAEDEKLLTYTSAPLDHALEVTGHPLVTLFVSSSADDGAFHVYLEDIDARGRVSYVTEGLLRAIHRRINDAAAPYRQPVPYRTFKREDAKPLVPGEVSELRFDLLPTSYVFEKGHHIRVAIAGADASHFTIIPGGPPTIAVHRNRRHASRIDLPVIEP